MPPVRRLALALLIAPAFGLFLTGADDTPATPRWIWLGTQPEPNQNAFFRREFQAGGAAKSARLTAACDDGATLLIDGKPVLEVKGWDTPVAQDVTAALRSGGRHVLAARCRNGNSAAGLVARLEIVPAEGDEPTVVVTDDAWKAAPRGTRDWATTDFDDGNWGKSTVVGKLGDGPWNVVTAARFDAARPRPEPTATAPDRIKAPKGFRVELLYSVPKDEQGSWVNLTVDPKGRLITSDQYGKLYRVTPPKLDGESADTQVEPIDVEIGEAQGLLWAFDSLYVMVNTGGKFRSGLYRVRDTDGDDRLDKVELLRELQGAGEHGPHGIVVGPDGKSLYVVAGNATKLPELADSVVPRYDEDQILPRMPDGRGFMRDETAPGGYVCRLDPEGKRWELFSMGFRNPYDIAFNKDGELFTYDSDMEWDINTPWYRPTRVCNVANGSDFGYRGGSGKWPTYYPDSLPPTVNIGPGSPTGIAFGYGAKFPAKYEQALFICDWSYGKLYAVHLEPRGSTYAAQVEEFLSAAPLPLTDVVVNPKDGALYFAIGGRKTTSGLYRVTFQEDFTDLVQRDRAGEDARALRHKLEAFHGHEDPAAVDAAWPHLGSEDRFIRYAARVAVEFQPPARWQDRALAETNPEAAINALIALARFGDKSIQPRLLDALGRLRWESLDVAQRLELLRAYELAFIRMGRPEGPTREAMLARLDPLLPADVREVNAELCKLLVYLEAPDVAAKAVALLEKAPTQEEQMEYAVALRDLRVGWTPELRKAYFTWFLKAAHFKGGASFALFVKNIRDDAVKTLGPEERAALKPVLDAIASPTTAAAPQEKRPFVKEWAVDELAPKVEQGLKARDFERGRSLFAAAQCASCHRYANEGGAVGPDLSGVSGRFSPRDLLESIVLPSKTISDQYEAVSIATADGRIVTGRIVNLNGDNLMVMTNMLDPESLTGINRRDVEEMKPSPVSLMPEGLLNTLSEDEVLDLAAFLLSGGNKDHAMFRR